MMLKRLLLLSAAGLLASSSAEAAGEVKTVFVIAMENHNWTQPVAADPFINAIKGNVAAPYINSLVTPGNINAAQVSYASNYENVPPGPSGPIHPSEPNYVWQEAGVTGPLNDAQPFPNNIVNAPNLSGLLQATPGDSWRSYQEGTDLVRTAGQLTNAVLPANQYTVPLTNFSGTSASYTNPYNGSHQFNYAAKHNPQVFFTATNGGNNNTPNNPEAKFYAPMEQLSTDLNNNTVAQYNWITPDQYNDMHSGLNGGFTYHGTHYSGDEALIAQGDNFLSLVVPMIEASQAYKNNGAIVIWNDETEGETTLPGLFTSMEIVISPLAKGNGYTNMIRYDHSSDLRTWQELFGVSPLQGTAPWLGGAAGATDLSDLFQAGAIPAPEPMTVSLFALGLVGAGALRRLKKSA